MRSAVAFTAAIGAALALAGCGGNPEDQVQRAVQARLRDPESARFSDVKRCGRSDIFTGNVNAKNSLGGYSGDKSFYFSDGQLGLLDEADRSMSIATIAGDWEALSARCIAAIEAETKRIRATLPPEHRRALDAELNAVSAR